MLLRKASGFGFGLLGGATGNPVPRSAAAGAAVGTAGGTGYFIAYAGLGSAAPVGLGAPLLTGLFASGYNGKTGYTNVVVGRWRTLRLLGQIRYQKLLAPQRTTLV